MPGAAATSKQSRRSAPRIGRELRYGPQLGVPDYTISVPRISPPHSGPRATTACVAAAMANTDEDVLAPTPQLRRTPSTTQTVEHPTIASACALIVRPPCQTNSRRMAHRVDRGCAAALTLPRTTSSRSRPMAPLPSIRRSSAEASRSQLLVNLPIVSNSSAGPAQRAGDHDRAITASATWRPVRRRVSRSRTRVRARRQLHAGRFRRTSWSG